MTEMCSEPQWEHNRHMSVDTEMQFVEAPETESAPRRVPQNLPSFASCQLSSLCFTCFIHKRKVLSKHSYLPRSLKLHKRLPGCFMEYREGKKDEEEALYTFIDSGEQI